MLSATPVVETIVAVADFGRISWVGLSLEEATEIQAMGDRLKALLVAQQDLGGEQRDMK